MSRYVEVKFLGNVADLDAATASAVRLLERYGGAADQAAKAAVDGAIQQRNALAELKVAYQELADSAVKGSDEQIVAQRRAAEASAQLARINQESAAKTTAAMDESRGAFAGATSGAFSFAKQIAFFGLGFAGFAGLKASIQTVLDAQTSIAQLDRAIVNVHASVKALTPVLDGYAESARKLGFADDQTRQAEAELITAFGATKKALDELRNAEDLARAKNEDLATAAQQLILLQEGNTRAAKQFGLALPDLAKAVWEQKAAQDGLTLSQEKGKYLYDELTPRIRDQAKAFAETPSGKLQEFHAQVQGLEESIGQALLPTVQHYLTAVDDWLSKSGNQQRVTHDVETAVHDLAGVLHDAETATKDILGVANPVIEALGGWKTAVEALIALKFASVLQGWYGGLEKLIGAQAVAGAEGAGLAGASSASSRLLGNMQGLARIGALGLGIDLLIKAHGDQGGKGFLESIFGAGLAGFAVGDVPGAAAAIGIDLFVHMLGGGSASAAAEQHKKAKQKYAQATSLALAAGDTQFQVADVASNAQMMGDTRAYKALMKIYDALVKAGPNATVTAAQARDYNALYSYKPGGPQGGEGPHHALKSNAAYQASRDSVVAGARYYGTGAGKGIYGSTPTDAGRALDCSAYVFEVFTRAGFKDFPRNSEDQWAQEAGANWYAERLSPDEAQPGDVAFYHVPGGEGSGMNHVGIVVSGHGSNAKVMQYYETGKGSATAGINAWYPCQGVKRFHKTSAPAGMGASSSSSPYGPAASTPGAAAASSANAAGSNKGAASALQTGLAALGVPQSLQDAVKMVAARSDAALKTGHTASAVHYLQEEADLLERERADLERKLKDPSLTGRQRQEIHAAMAKIQAAVIHIGAEISSALGSWAKSQATTIEKEADAAFTAQTNAYIKNVLAPRYFQGVDAQGNKRMTPAEAQLAQMQAEDTQQSLTSALTQAQQQLASDTAAGATSSTLASDQQAIDQAQRQITENELSIQATQERAKADADYAKAVAHYQEERAKKEQALNEALLKFLTAVSKGTEGLNMLSQVLQRFGLAPGAVTLPHHHAGGTHPSSHAGGHGGHKVRVHTHRHVHHHHHHHHAITGHDRQGRVVNDPATGGPPSQTIILDIDGRKLASAIAPRSDKVVRVKLS